MMQQKPLFPLLALLGGCVGLGLRLWQNAVGFEPGTGLVIADALPGWIFPGALAVLALVLGLCVRRLPREAAGSFSPEDCGTIPAATLAVLGILLAGGAGVLAALVGMAQRNWVELLLGGLTVLALAALLPAAVACKRGGCVQGVLLLVPVAYGVVRLVLTYRVCSVDPVLAAYYVEILALAALVMAFYRFSAFGYRCGQTKRFVYWAMLAVVLCMSTLADFLPVGNRVLDPAALGFYGGCVLLLLGLLLHRLRNRGPNAPPRLPKTGSGRAQEA